LTSCTPECGFVVATRVEVASTPTRERSRDFDERIRGCFFAGDRGEAAGGRFGVAPAGRDARVIAASPRGSSTRELPHRHVNAGVVT
jgi:hypothetical protein